MQRTMLGQDFEHISNLKVQVNRIGKVCVRNEESSNLQTSRKLLLT